MKLYCGIKKDERNTRYKCWGKETPSGEIICGNCEIARCCRAHGHYTCAECEDFPCDRLLACSHDPVTGDDGLRLGLLREARELALAR